MVIDQYSSPSFIPSNAASFPLASLVCMRTTWPTTQSGIPSPCAPAAKPPEGGRLRQGEDEKVLARYDLAPIPSGQGDSPWQDDQAKAPSGERIGLAPRPAPLPPLAGDLKIDIARRKRTLPGCRLARDPDQNLKFCVRPELLMTTSPLSAA